MAALLVVLPFALFGTPSGHDLEFHLSSWMETVSQWKQGIAFPRWADLAHFGYGEARFIFYPPLSWLLGGALGALCPWAATAAIYVWIVLSLGGWCMFRLAREWLPDRDAIVAAALYTVNPYHIVAVYWRSSYAELLADALFPLMLLWILRCRQSPRRALVPLSLTLATIWLSNAPAAVIATYLLVASAILLCILDQNWLMLPYVGMAVVLALGLAAFYIIPAAWEQKWVEIVQVLSPGVRPGDNFLFTNIIDPEHNQFNLLVSLVAAAQIVILAITAAALAKWRKERRGLWWVLVMWAAVSTLLMIRITDPLWEHLPKLKFVQLPWRWLVPLNVAFALLAAAAIRRTLSRVIFMAGILVAMLALSHRVLAPWWDRPQDIAALHQSVTSGAGYEGTDEYVPQNGDAYEIKPDAPQVEIRSENDQIASGTIGNVKWFPEVKKFTVNVSQPSQLVLRLFNYPAWHAQVNGRPVPIATRDVTGQMVIAVPAGQSRVILRFTRTPDRTVGAVVSIVFAVIIFLMVSVPALRRRRTLPQT